MFVIPVMFTFKSMLACREDRWATPCLGQPPPPPHVHPFLGAGTRQRRSLLPADLSGDLPIRAPPPPSVCACPHRGVFLIVHREPQRALDQTDIIVAVNVTRHVPDPPTSEAASPSGG